jgi:hypothetical protein
MGQAPSSKPLSRTPETERSEVEGDPGPSLETRREAAQPLSFMSSINFSFHARRHFFTAYSR